MSTSAARTRRLRDEVVEAIQEAETCLDDYVEDRLRKLGKEVAGVDALHFRTAERLLRTASMALEEATQWLEEIKCG